MQKMKGRIVWKNYFAIEIEEVGEKDEEGNMNF